MIKTYPNYKTTDQAWLGIIPEHWEVLRLGSKFLERKTKVSDKDYAPISVTKNGIVPQLETAAKSNDGDNRKLVKKGDFVINSRSDRKGSSGISDLDGSVSLINIVMKPQEMNGKYCHYLLRSNSFIEEYYRNGHGIVADLWTTRYDEMKNIKIGIPPLPEQQAIAAYLDDKTAKIETAIAQKEKLIELLKERKQIVIQELVTGKKVWSEVQDAWTEPLEVKDSGVEWIGEIPKGWEVKKVKHIGKINSGEAIVNNQLSDNGLFEVFGGNGLMGFTDKFNIENDVIIIGRVGALCGNIRISRGKRWISDNALILKLISNENLNFIGQLLESADLNKLNSSNAQPLITGSKVLNFSIPYPNYKIQNIISNEIQTQSTKIDKAIALQVKQIEKLKEYKQVLIDEVVRGKRRVC